MYKIILFLTLSGLIYSFTEDSKIYSVQNQLSIKKKAFLVLDQKCNTCHIKKYTSAIFTEENMNAFAASIHQQVFIKKRMPKGRVKLTADEQNNLEAWLSNMGKMSSKGSK